MASTPAFDLPLAAQPSNPPPWVEIAAGAFAVLVVQNLRAAPSVVYVGPASAPPADGADGYVLPQEFSDLDLSGVLGATDKAWARAYSRAGRVVTVKS